MTPDARSPCLLDETHGKNAIGSIDKAQKPICSNLKRNAYEEMSQEIAL